MIENKNEIIGAIEAILFAAGEPLPLDAITELLAISKEDLIVLLEQIKSNREEMSAGIILRKVDDGYQFCTNPMYSGYVNMLLGSQRRQPLSQAALETLSIIAYKQPVTRSDIENIRGIKSSNLVTMLMEKGLIEKVGVKDTLGHPALLGTTKEFLIHFNLESLDDLPLIEPLCELQEQAV